MKPDYVGDEGKIFSEKLERYVSEVKRSISLKKKIFAAELNIVLLGPHHLSPADNGGYGIMAEISAELKRRGIFATPMKPISERIPEAASSAVGDAVIESADLLVLLHLNTSAPSQAYGDEVGNIRRNPSFCEKAFMLVPEEMWIATLGDLNYASIMRKFPVKGRGNAFVKESADIIESQVRGLVQQSLNKR